MPAENITRSVYGALEKQGFKSKIVSIRHIDELRSDIETLYHEGWLANKLYDRYLANFDFKLTDSLPEARSLIVVTAPQPKVRVSFSWQNRVFDCIIPPTYCTATDKQIKDCLEKCLLPEGFYMEKKRLPEKLLAVRSGLAQYGKNNLTYVPGMGSFHRPAVFVSDLPCLEDNWREARTSKACNGCNACVEACPTGAMASDRFLLYAERCITFHNEQPETFPDWLDSSWHSCLVGCMECQAACPMNQKIADWIEDGMTFDAHETDFLLNSSPADAIPEKTAVKLEKLGLTVYASVLGRNLKTLIGQRHHV